MAPPIRYPNTEARRAVVKQQLDHYGTLTMVQRRALAEQFHCTATVIGHDIAFLRGAAEPATHSMGVETLLSMADERETAILRALGRLEMMTSTQIKGLIFPDTSHESMRRRLLRLEKQGLIWMTTTSMPTMPNANGRSHHTPKAPYVYGLTHEGKTYLESAEAEPHEPSYTLLKSRDRRAPDIPRQQLAHDLQAASWCCSMIDAARRCSLLVDIRCQVEYVSAYDEHGRERQRFDAYLALRFQRQPQPQRRPGWLIPWYDGEPDSAGDVTVRFALEVDRGTEKLSILMAKALMYHQLTQSGHYTQRLGGPVLPIILVPPGKRAAQIAREWQTGWPNGLGVISTPAKASHEIYGALWGQYLTLKDSPAKPATLLGTLVPSLEAWEQLVRHWVPGTPTGQ
jgi:hypothetical protein